MESIHQDQPVIKAGLDASNAAQGVILLHGRGALAQSLVPLAQSLGLNRAAFRIPQAGSQRWYPHSAFDSLSANQPDLDSALEVIDRMISELEDAGIPGEQIYLGGFSQGACLAAEYGARNTRRYGGIFIFSGALIGPRGLERDYTGSLQGTPVFIGCSDQDPWVAHDLVENTAQTLSDLGGMVDFRTYPGLGHTINQEEIEVVSAWLE